jgi:RHS repeat-associated protein
VDPVTNATCSFLSSFIFSDSSGVEIPFGQVYGEDHSSTEPGRLCPGASSLSQSVDGYQIELIPGCTPTPNCIQGALFGGAKVTDPSGTVYYFGKQIGFGAGAEYGTLTSIEDRNGNIYSANSQGVLTTDTDGRPMTAAYPTTSTNSSASFPVPSLQVQVNPTVNCGFPSQVSDTQRVVQSITLPNGQQYHFYYGNDNPNGFTNPYGLLSEIDYPSGAWVRYTWKLADQMSILANFDGVSSAGADQSNACFYQYKFPVVATRQVGLGGSSQPILTQSFSYATTWGGSTWSQKTTTVTTTDNVRNQTFQMVYSYQPFTVTTNGPSSTSHPPPYQVPLESSVQYYNPGGSSPIRTVAKTWIDQYEMASQTTTLQDGVSSMSSKTTYAYHAIGLPSEIDEYDYGQTTPTRKTGITYQSFTDTAIFPYNPSLLDKPCKKIVSDGSGNAAAETDYLYDGGTAVCGSAGSAPVSTANSPVQHDSLYAYSASPQPPRGNLTKTISKCLQGPPGCNGDSTTTFAFDETGQMMSKTDPCGNAACGDMTGSAHTTSYSYADSYTILSGGANVNYTPTANTNGYLTKIIDAPGHTENFTYDYNNGQLTTSKDQNGQPTTYIYNDPFFRPTQVAYPDHGGTTISYNDAPPTPSATTTTPITSSLSMTSISVMDGMGHITQTQLTSDPDGTDYTDMVFDGMGRLETKSNPHRSGSSTTDGTTTYTYDALGRTTSVLEQDGSHITTTHSGNCTTVTDEASKAKKSCADALGRITGVWEDPNTLNYETDYSYDVLDDLLTVTQKGGSSSGNWRTRSFAYNSLSELVSATNPESGAANYSYDLNGNVATKIAPLPNQTGSATVTTSYSYDALNRVIQKTYSNGTATMKYGYDGVALTGCTTPQPVLTDNYPLGRRTDMCDGSGSTAWSHDVMGRVLIKKEKMGSAFFQATDYAYNLDGSVSTVTYPTSNVLSYGYSGAQRPVSARNTTLSINYVSACTTTPCYTPNGALQNINYDAGMKVTDGYNPRLQPLFLSATGPVSTILSLSYDFHAGNGDNGNVYQIMNGKDGNRTQNFSYDSLNRIQQAYTNGPNWGETYTIDAWGNLSNRAGVSGKTNYEPLSQTVLTNNQFACSCYDAAGNMTSSGSASYTYDAENHLLTAGGYTYTYDGDGNRVMKSNGSTGTIYWRGADGEVIDEGNLSDIMQEEYVYFGGKRVVRWDVPTGHRHYYFSDHLGSSNVVTDNLGNIQDESDYYPYGGEIQITNTYVNTYKFTAKERDAESGLDHFGRRHYASTLGRWMSPDPINLTGARLVNPGSTLNKYVYGADNPLKYLDKDGEDITIFYRPSGISPTDFGHIFIGALNQNTGEVGFLDYYPQGHGNGPGEFNPGNMQDRANTSNQFAALTIRTTPDEAQKVLDLIKALKNGPAPNYAALTNNCTTICEDVLRDLGLDFGDMLPDDYWSHVYGHFSPAALDNPFKNFFIPRKTGIDYGNPRDYGMNFTRLLFQLYLNQWNEQQNHQKPPKACVTTFGPHGPETTCEQ